MRYISLICFIQVTSSVLTSSPYNRLLEERRAAKVNKATATGLTASRAQKRTTCSSTGLDKKKTPRNAPAKQQWDCLVCGESYSDSRSGESWIECQLGYRWAHHMRAQKVARVMCVTTASRTMTDLARNLLLL